MATVAHALRLHGHRRARGAYTDLAGQYHGILARDGVSLELRPSAGVLDNLALAQDPASGVDAALVQAGSAREAVAGDLVSLGTVFHEPIGFFCRYADAPASLRGLWMSVGPVGSSGREIACAVSHQRHRVLRGRAGGPGSPAVRASPDSTRGHSVSALVGTATVERRMRHRVYSLYGELKWIARELHETLDTERRRGLMRQPDDLEERVFRMRMPKAYTGLGYTFRLNIQRLRASRVKEPPAGAAQVVPMPET